MRDLDIPDEKVNVNGGAIAMGHPLGATGAHDPRHAGRRARAPAAAYGLVTLCVGGGMGVATIIERVWTDGSESWPRTRHPLGARTPTASSS